MPRHLGLLACIGVAISPLDNAPGEGVPISVPNPSFETNTTDGGTTYQTLYAGFTGLPGWTFSGDSNCVLIGDPDDSYPYATPFGMWQIDLTGSATSGAAWIETILTGMTPGARYKVRFNFGTSTDWVPFGAGDPAVTVSVTDNTPQTFSHAPITANDRTALVYAFTAPASGTGALRFTNASPNGIGFAAIDNISATAIVPPSLSLQPGDEHHIVFTGVLQDSTDLLSWLDVPGATSPFVMPLAGPRRFYRAREE